MDGKLNPFFLPSKTPARERFAWAHSELRDAAGENWEGSTGLPRTWPQGPENEI